MSKVSERAAHRCQDKQLAVLNRVRCQRGRALFRARAAEIWRVGADTYRVPSQSGGGIYHVCLGSGAEHCTCPDFARYGRRTDIEPGDFACKHLYAALMAMIKTEAAQKLVSAA